MTMIPEFIVEALAAKDKTKMPPAPKVMADGIEIGDVIVPDGKRGVWEIDTFTVSEREAKLFNVRNRWSGSPLGRWQDVYPGTYKRLTNDKVLMMSNTHMERYTNRELVQNATGRVLINGLGLGMVLTAILKKPSVTHVRVVEIDADIIALVAPSFKAEKRVEIIHADALQRKFERDERYDFAWHDIWPIINGDENGKQARTLQARGRGRVSAQGVWAREFW
jgi:hypothetical protein